jgi:predicted DCC family thiol-disulfide oxidoreductase YuxK
MSEISVIYDGQCELCNNSINWLKKKIEITALDFHGADLSSFGLSLEQCSREVFVVTGDKTLNGAGAVAYLLKHRGNRVLSTLITLSGPIGRSSYRWVAGNRNSAPVKLLSYLLRVSLRFS